MVIEILLSLGLLQGAPSAGDSLEKEAVSVFTAKCTQCHGSNLPHPKAGFNFVTDPRRLIESGKYVVPGNPDKSEVWKEIDEGDMPPDSAKAGPLTDAEKKTIHDWIASMPRQQGVSGPLTATHAQESQKGLDLDKLIKLLGRLHVLALHFPIALLATGAGLEMYSVIRGQGQGAVQTVVRMCVWLGAISALAAAGLGWIHAMEGFGQVTDNPLGVAGLHRWLGTLVACSAPLAAWMYERGRSGRGRKSASAAVVLLGPLTVAAAHFGGLLTHGTTFFSP